MSGKKGRVPVNVSGSCCPVDFSGKEEQSQDQAINTGNKKWFE